MNDKTPPVPLTAPVGGIALSGRMGRGKSYLAGLVAQEALAAGQRVAWIWPASFVGRDADLPAAILQLSTPTLDGVEAAIAGLDLDLAVVDSAERPGISVAEASAAAEALAQRIGVRVIITVAS